MKTDFNYTTDGAYFTLYPNNSEAEIIWAQIEDHFKGRIPFTAWPSVKHQIREAGYTVRKTRRRNSVDTDKLLAELGVKL